MAGVRSRYRRRLGSRSCYLWQCRRTQNLLKENESGEGSESEGCDSEHENSLGPSVEIMVGEWDAVGRWRRTTRTKKDENKGDQEDNVVGGGQGG